MTSRHEPATLISWSLPRQRDVTPYRSPGRADVLRGARADVTDFSYMTLMDTSVVKHNMLKCDSGEEQCSPLKMILGSKYVGANLKYININNFMYVH